MGFFKDAKDGIKGAKELGDYHGGMPSMRGAFKDLAALSNDQGQGEILKKGVPAKARVLSFAMPHPTEKFTMQIDLEITPQEGEPYRVTYLYPTARQKEALSVGMDVPVKVMPDDPNAVAVAVGRAEGLGRRAGRRDERGDGGPLQHLRGHRRRRGTRRDGRPGARHEPVPAEPDVPARPAGTGTRGRAAPAAARGQRRPGARASRRPSSSSTPASSARRSSRTRRPRSSRTSERVTSRLGVLPEERAELALHRLLGLARQA